MRVVTDGAVFHDRLVVVQEGAAFFHVAGVAGLVDTVFLQLFWPCRTMRIVTIGTGYLALQNWVV